MKIGGDTAELQRALATVGEKARGLDTDLKKLGNTPIAAQAQKSLDAMRATMTEITKAQQGVADRAAAAAEGIAQIGGASRLTDSQLKAVNKTLQDGLSAFRALGQDAPAHLKTVADAVESNLAQPMGAVQGKIIALGTALGTFLGNAAVEVGRQMIQAGKAAFEYGDKLENLSASTRVSVEGLQRLESIGVTADVTLDQLANSVEQLQKHLDDTGAKDALRQMGLDYQFIRSLAPEDQFLEIAKAVAAVKDPVEQANAGAALFGRTWTTIAPAIQGNIQEIIDQTKILTKEQVHALSEAQNAWERWKFNVGKNIDEVLGNIVLAGSRMDEVNRRRDQLFKDLNDPDQTLPTLPGAPRLFSQAPLSILAAPEDLTKAKLFGLTLDEQREKMDEARAAAEKFKSVQSQLFGRATIAHAEELAHALGGTENVTKLTGDATKKLHSELAGALEVYHALGRDVPPAIQAIFDKTAPLVLQMRTIGNGMVGANLNGMPSIAGFSLEQLAKQSALTKKLLIPKLGSQTFSLPGNAAGNAATSFGSDLAASVPNSILAAIQGGGSKLQAAGSAIGMSLFGKDSAVTKSITGLFSADGFLGKTLSSAVPIIGSLIGPAIEGLGKLWGKVFGTAGRDSVRDFASKFGGFDDLHVKLGQLGADGETLWKNLTQGVGRNNADQAAAAIKKVTDAFQLQDTALADLKAAVQKYGFSIEELGPKFAQQNLNEQQGQLLKEWKLLNAAVTDHDVLLRKTAGSFQEIVAAALKSGATISSEFEGPIQSLIDMGLLVDENGEKLTDLSRIKFGSLDTEFSKLTTAINNLTRALGGAVDEADNLAKDREATITVRTNFDTSDVPNSSDFPVFQEAEGFAEGTKGWRNFGAGTPAVLHGIEAVVTPDQVGSLNAAGAAASDGSEPSLTINFNGPVLAATDWIEQNVVTPVLTSIERYHRPRFGRLVASVTP